MDDFKQVEGEDVDLNKEAIASTMEKFNILCKGCEEVMMSKLERDWVESFKEAIWIGHQIQRQLQCVNLFLLAKHLTAIEKLREKEVKNVQDEIRMLHEWKSTLSTSAKDIHLLLEKMKFTHMLYSKVEKQPNLNVSEK